MPIQRPHDGSLGMPSPEALQMATGAIRRRYALPATMDHPAVKFECTWLAYLVQAYGLASERPEPQDKGVEKSRDAVSLRYAPTTPLRECNSNLGRKPRSSRTRELVDA